MDEVEVKRIQEYLGLTNEAMARLFDVSVFTVSKWRSGKVNVLGPTALLLRVFEWMKRNSIDNPFYSEQ